jgi:hypothetical protein
VFFRAARQQAQRKTQRRYAPEGRGRAVYPDGEIEAIVWPQAADWRRQIDIDRAQQRADRDRAQQRADQERGQKPEHRLAPSSEEAARAHQPAGRHAGGRGDHQPGGALAGVHAAIVNKENVCIRVPPGCRG